MSKPMANSVNPSPYRQTDPREGLRQALLVRNGLAGGAYSTCVRSTLVEWIPKKFKVGDDVAVSGLPGRWLVEIVYNPLGRN